MAATKGTLSKLQQDKIREAIQTTQLVKRLQFFALGQKDPAEVARVGEDKAQPVELDAGRLKAIDMLIRKTLPDLSAVTISGDADQPLVHKVIREIVNIQPQIEHLETPLVHKVVREGVNAQPKD